MAAPRSMSRGPSGPSNFSSMSRGPSGPSNMSRGPSGRSNFAQGPQGRTLYNQERGSRSLYNRQSDFDRGKFDRDNRIGRDVDRNHGADFRHRGVVSGNFFEHGRHFHFRRFFNGEWVFLTAWDDGIAVAEANCTRKQIPRRPCSDLGEAHFRRHRDCHRPSVGATDNVFAGSIHYQRVGHHRPHFPLLRHLATDYQYRDDDHHFSDGVHYSKHPKSRFCGCSSKA
jgi:hypothetical protein